MAAQAWLTALGPVDRRAFSVLKGTATPEQRALILRFIEHPTFALAQEKNARFVAALVNGHSTLSKEPCPVPVLVAGLQAWLAAQEASQTPSPNYVTAVTYVDDAWNTFAGVTVSAALEASKTSDGFTCASLRQHNPKGPVWIVKLGMIDYSDQRHPERKIPGVSAVLSRDGMFHLPRATAGGPLTHNVSNHAVTPAATPT